LKLSDGRVLLVGGTRQVAVDFNNTVTVRPSGDHLVTTAEVFDPGTNQFSPAGSSVDIGRADTAAVAMINDKVVLMGGRTVSLKSDGIVAGPPSGDTWTFSATGTSLLTPRSGARATRLTAGVLVVGGNATGTDPVELLDPVSLSPETVSLSTTASLSVVGHSLTQLSGIEALMAGGVPDDTGAFPGNGVVSISLGSNPPTVWEGTLQHPRAFHAASLLEDGSVLLAGGLDDTFSARKDLEVLTPGGSSQVLTEATLGIESIGMAAARLPDGSVLLAGGLDLETGGTVKLSSVVQLLSP
jgi:ABC-type amino acid transport substrate-binding protein